MFLIAASLVQPCSNAAIKRGLKQSGEGGRGRTFAVEEQKARASAPRSAGGGGRVLRGRSAIKSICQVGSPR